MSDAATTECVSLDALDGDGRQRLFEGDPPTVRLTLDAGEEIPPHRHPDRDIVCHVLSGTLTMGLGSETVDLAAGEVARFGGDQDIAPQAATDCEALLVLAPRA